MVADDMLKYFYTILHGKLGFKFRELSALRTHEMPSLIFREKNNNFIFSEKYIRILSAAVVTDVFDRSVDVLADLELPVSMYFLQSLLCAPFLNS